MKEKSEISELEELEKEYEIKTNHLLLLISILIKWGAEKNELLDIISKHEQNEEVVNNKIVEIEKSRELTEKEAVAFYKKMLSSLDKTTKKANKLLIKLRLKAKEK